MRVRLNGKVRDVEEAMTLARLVDELNLNEDVIAVELNRVVVRRASYAEKRLGADDEIEIVTLVGGG